MKKAGVGPDRLCAGRAPQVPERTAALAEETRATTGLLRTLRPPSLVTSDKDDHISVTHMDTNGKRARAASMGVERFPRGGCGQVFEASASVL